MRLVIAGGIRSCIEPIHGRCIAIDGMHRPRCKKTFLRFFIQGTFFNVFLFSNVFFIFKNVHWKYHLKSLSKQRKQIGSVWLLEFPYRPIYWQALLFTYRIGLHRVTPLGVVFLFMLVNWWVEKHQRFLFNVYRRFFYLVTFLRFLMFFIFFWNVFFTSMMECDTNSEYIFRTCQVYRKHFVLAVTDDVSVTWL